MKRFERLQNRKQEVESLVSKSKRCFQVRQAAVEAARKSPLYLTNMSELSSKDCDCEAIVNAEERSDRLGIT